MKAKSNRFFESAEMRVEVSAREKEEKGVRQLEGSGLKRELLPSRKNVEPILYELSRNKLEICKKFALKYCVVVKRRMEGLIPKIIKMDSEAIIEALKLYSRGQFTCTGKTRTWVARGSDGIEGKLITYVHWQKKISNNFK